jgi:hypothetical protein
MQRWRNPGEVTAAPLCVRVVRGLTIGPSDRGSNTRMRILALTGEGCERFVGRGDRGVDPRPAQRALIPPVRRVRIGWMEIGWSAQKIRHSGRYRRMSTLATRPYLVIERDKFR